MKRTLLAACIVTLTAVAGCGSDAATPPPATPTPGAATSAPAPAAAPAAGPGESVPGVPALLGTPTDLSAPVQAQAGEGAPPTQLVTQDLVVGSGPAATLDSTVAVRYTGTLYADGSLFDSSWSRGDEPISFPLDGVVPGFAQGIEGMQVGGRRVMVIPAELGYGNRPTGSIPAGSTLVFVVDVVAVG